MRTLSTAAAADVVKPITTPFHLVELVMASATYRWSTRGTVSWDSQTWTEAGVMVEGLRNLVGGGMEGAISITNTDNAASALVLADGVADRECRVWQLNGAGPYVLADAVKLFDGVCDGADIGLDRVRIDIITAKRVRETAPRIYFEAFCAHMPAAGTVLAWGGEHYTLENRNG